MADAVLDRDREAREDDFAEHVRTYRGFVRYTLLFAAHAAVILALLAYWLL